MSQMVCGYCGVDLRSLPPEANMVPHWNGTCKPAERPVATQLERIEQGIDALLQSHAALDAKIQTFEEAFVSKATNFDKQLNQLCGYVGANQAVLDTLVQRVGDNALAIRALLTALEQKLDRATHAGAHADKQFGKAMEWARRVVKSSTNGKRKR